MLWRSRRGVWWGLATHQRATRRGIRAPSPHHLSLQRSPFAYPLSPSTSSREAVRSCRSRPPPCPLTATASSDGRLNTISSARSQYRSGHHRSMCGCGRGAGSLRHRHRLRHPDCCGAVRGCTCAGDGQKNCSWRARRRASGEGPILVPLSESRGDTRWSSFHDVSVLDVCAFVAWLPQRLACRRFGSLAGCRNHPCPHAAAAESR